MASMAMATGSMASRSLSSAAAHSRPATKASSVTEFSGLASIGLNSSTPPSLSFSASISRRESGLSAYVSVDSIIFAAPLFFGHVILPPIVLHVLLLSSSTAPTVPWNAPLRIKGREPAGPFVKERRRVIARRAAGRVQYNVPQEPETIPLWLWIFANSYQTVKYALHFLWEQPGQLQYIEWPSLQSTIKMAMLTVVVVTLLIIFLATIDSTFSFVLSSILRRVP